MGSSSASSAISALNRSSLPGLIAGGLDPQPQPFLARLDQAQGDIEGLVLPGHPATPSPNFGQDRLAADSIGHHQGQD
jgi:hypothetical protein